MKTDIGYRDALRYATRHQIKKDKFAIVSTTAIEFLNLLDDIDELLAENNRLQKAVELQQGAPCQDT